MNEAAKHDLIVGVIGGMGPEATADFYQKLLMITPAQKDQDHLRVIIDSNAKIPDRIAAILGDSEDPTPVLQEMARNLQRAGADFLVIPCNTAHYYYDAIQAAVEITVLHIQKEVFNTLSHSNRNLRKVGLLATTATIRTELYQHFAKQTGVMLIIPDAEQQERLVTAGIRAVKAHDRDKGRVLLSEAAQLLASQGVEAIIEGCTEIPLVLFPDDFEIPLIDATLVLAEATLATARRNDDGEA